MHCARVCPVHAIVVKVGNESPQIDHERCIGCGACITACGHEGLIYFDSTEGVKRMLEGPDKVAALVDPSISGEFPDITDYRKFVEMIRQLGFAFVTDASFGVDLVAQVYKKLFSNERGKFYITANCPAIADMVCKFHPDLTDNLAPIVSPMIAQALMVKKRYGENTRTVYIGPCIAAKKDTRDFDPKAVVDSVITFVELRRLFEQNNIQESQLEYSDFDPPVGRLGSLYPISQGILEAAGVNEKLMEGNVLTADGNPSSLKAIHSFEHHTDQIRKHINVFYNEGCVMGPGMSAGGDKLLRTSLVLAYSQRRISKIDLDKWNSEIENYKGLDLSRAYLKNDKRAKEPAPAKVDEILSLLEKNDDSSPSCAICGFESCRNFAKAVAQGLTRTDMCFDFNIKNKQKYIETLRDSRARQNTELSTLNDEMKNRQAEFELTNTKLETSRAIMNQIPSGVVIVDDKLKITSSNRSFIELLGDDAREIDEIIPGLRGADLKTLVPVQFYKVFQNVLATGENILSRDVKINEAFLNLSVFSIQDRKVVGGIVRDMFSPEVRNEQIIHRVGEVIDQNLTMVQQIGFLLGEGASKTEAMLNSIAELHRKKKKTNLD